MFKYALPVFIAFCVTNANAQYFHGYPCTVDCGGHEAGYQWAQDNDITDESSCSANSNSFNEGCQSAVEEYQAERAQEDESSENEY